MALDSADEAGKNQVMEADGLSQEPAVVLLDDVGLLRFEGPDVIGFLQGYLTSDAAELGDDPGFTAICNIRGRAVCTGYAWLDGQAVFLALHRSLCDTLQDFLRPYLVFSKTVLSDASSSVLVLGALGDAAHMVPGLLSAHRLDEGRRLLLVSPDGPAADPAPDVRRYWDLALIERREVWLTAETSGRFLPQMLALDRIGAVSFSKGCYLGQEVVARAQHLGEVKRKLSALDWSGIAPSPGTVVEANGRNAGTVVAAAGAEEGGSALAVLRKGLPGPFSAPDSGTAFVLRK